MTLFMLTIAIFIIILLSFMFSTSRAISKMRNYLKEKRNLNFKLDKFKGDFDIRCESCDTKFNTSLSNNCPSCGAPYGKNKQYLELKKKNNIDYYDYTLKMEEDLKTEYELYNKARKLIKRNPFIDFSKFEFNIYNYEFKERKNFTIECEYCSTKIDTDINGKGNCPNCGAPYNDNIEIKINRELNKYAHLKKQTADALMELKEESNKKAEKKSGIWNRTRNINGIIFVVLAMILSFAIALVINYICTNMFHENIRNIFYNICLHIPNIIEFGVVIILVVVIFKAKSNKEKSN